MTAIEKLIRPDILELKAYSSARNTYNEEGSFLLDANENPYGKKINRYPDPFQRELKREIARMYGTREKNLFLGNGSDEILDLAFRVFCRPGIDNVVTMDPSYGMYEVLAKINHTAIRKVKLNPVFDLDADALLARCDRNTKMIILCSPNNPTGNLLNVLDIYRILNSFDGIVLIDEAYIEFSGSRGFYQQVRQFPNLVVLRTFSKAWGLAGIRLGYAFAGAEIIQFMNKAKYPYNINRLTQQKAMQALKQRARMRRWVNRLNKERERLGKLFSEFSFVKKVYPSQANFFLVEVEDPAGLLYFLKERKLIVRDRSGLTHCEKCIRVTIGSKKQNNKLLKTWRAYEEFISHGY